MAQSVMWKLLTAAELREKAQAGAIVVLAGGRRWSSMGRACRWGVGTILTEAVCQAAAEAIAADTAVVVAPTLWCGIAEHHMAFGSTFTFDIPTYRAVLFCFLKSIERHGFTPRADRQRPRRQHRGVVGLPAGHRPRDRSQGWRMTTYFDQTKVALAEILEDQKGVHHACEAETSLMMVVAPDTVRRGSCPSTWTSPLLDASGGHRSLPLVPRRTASGVIGDARRSSAQKGEKMLAALRDGMAAALRNPATWS